MDIKSYRRQANTIVGFVNFPTNSIPNTGEGGCFVRLVVMDNSDYQNRWQPCSGGENNFYYDELFLGDDLFSRTEYEDDWRKQDQLMKSCQLKYFPNLENENANTMSNARYLSRNFLCVMTIGATGWSSGDWVCKVEDLTEEGRKLYHSLELLYPNCEIRLLTFLDT